VLWLAGRVLPFFSGVVPHWLIAVVDLAFLPVLGASLAVPLIRKRQKHNLVFLLLLAGLTLANLLVHLQLLGITRESATPGNTLGVGLVVLLIAILGGRVIPFFTGKGIAGATTRQWKPVEFLSLAALPVLVLLDLAQASPAAIMLFALLTATGHGIRLFGWYHRGIWSVPLLWVLHLGYAWLVSGFLLQAFAAAGLVNPMLAVHAFTAGGIGTLTLGMMSRVALGHTGRELRAAPAMTWAFMLVSLAACSRVFLPLVVPAAYREWMVLAGACWSAAFALFVFHYARILIQPRVDGRPG
jgi:uncharacterized protein involved in response to NO